MTDQATANTQPAEMIAALGEIYDNANRLIAEVTPQQWTSQTPCSEWNVRDLVNHMTGTTKFFVISARRGTPADAPDADHPGDDPAAAFTAAATESLKTWQSAGAVDGMVSLPFEMPAIVALGINLIDIGTHCWDIAEAVGADHGLTTSLVSMIDHWNREVVTDQVRSGGGFGEPLTPTDTGDLSTMLVFVGRLG